MKLTPKEIEILEKIVKQVPLENVVDPVALASYLASIQQKEDKRGWICGKCEQESGKYPNTERLEKHSLHCDKRKEEEKVEEWFKCECGLKHPTSGCHMKCCPHCVLKPPLLNIPRPKGWSAGRVLGNFRWWLAAKDLTLSDLDDTDLDRYYQEFLKSIK